MAASNGIQLASISNPQFSSFGQDDFILLYEDLQQRIENFISTCGANPHLQVQTQNMHALLECVINVRRTRESTAQQSLLKKTVESLMEGFVGIPEYVEQIKMYRDIHLRILKILQDNRAFGAVWTNKSVSRYLYESPENIRYNIEAVEILIQAGCVYLPHYDTGLKNLIEGGNYTTASFATKLLQVHYLDERSSGTAQAEDFQNTILILERLAMHNNGPEVLINLLEILRSQQDQSVHLTDRAGNGPTSYIHSGMLQARNASDIDEPPGFLTDS